MLVPAHDPHAGASDPEVRSDRGDEGVIGLTIVGRGSDRHAKDSGAHLFDVGATCAGRDSD